MMKAREGAKAVAITLAVLMLGGANALAAAWPQYKGDAGRSGVAQESLGLPLQLSWVYQPRQTPRPAWEEPGKEVSRLDFDYAPQPVIAGGRVFFCSSADDTVRALELKSGQVVWRFTTGGPVRFAPAVAGDKVYVGSDDGWLYCLNAETGGVVWRFHAAPAGDLLLGNGRMISRWPLRSGAVVLDGVVYTAAGMWPEEGVYVYALDAETGDEIWRNDSTGVQYAELPHPGSWGFSGVAPQGYLVVSEDVLLVPTGRAIPGAFDRHTGDFLYCWTHRNWDDAKRGGCWITACGDIYFNTTREPRGTSESYVGEASPLPNDGMVAYELKTGKPLFDLKGKHRVLASGDTLYAVGGGEAAAYDLAALRAGKGVGEAAKWKAPHLRVYSLALSGDTLFVGGKGVLVALDANTGARRWYRTQDMPGPIRGLAIAEGRLVAATDQGVLTCFSPGRAWGAVVNDAPDWRMEIPQKAFAAADAILRRYGKEQGYALVVGEEGVQAAAALAMRSELHVIVAARDEAQATAARQALMHTDLYGSRVEVECLSDAGRFPFASYFADIVVVLGETEGLSGQEFYRVLRPCGGMLIFGDEAAPGEPGRLVREAAAPAQEMTTDEHGRPVIVRGPLPGAGEWRRQWADGGRTGIGDESRLTMPLELLWFGGPGPNRMMDRHFGSSSPLSVNGRVFVTGEHDLIAFDAYNGRELWARSMRSLGRRGAMWNTANFAADDAMIYAVIGAACYRISQETGAVLGVYAIPGAVAEGPAEWQYVDVAGDRVLGSCRHAGRSSLFALDKHDGALRWQWTAAYDVPMSAIAFGDGRLYCLDIEPGNEQAKRRGMFNKTTRSLVALSLDDGTEVWRRDDVPGTPQQHVQFAKGVVSIYANAAYDAATGDTLWQRNVAPSRPPIIHGDWVIAPPYAYDLHTGEQRTATDAVTGEGRPWELTRSYGCGGFNGCQTLLFFRSAAAGFYDFETDGTTNFGGVRPGCATNIIGANGLAILPETSSGCTCTYNFQTSLALIPSGDSRPKPWYVFQGGQSPEPAAHLCVNLGAPGDRLGPDGVRWLAAPRPTMSSAAPVALGTSSERAAWYRHPREDELSGLDQPWLYGSGVRDPGRITLDLIASKPVVALACAQPLGVDGKLDEGLAGQPKIHLGFSNNLKRRADAYLRYDDNNLYIAIVCTGEAPDQGGVPWVKKCQGEDARVWEDDSWEIYLSDRAQKAGVHLGVSASGARFDGVWDYTAYEPLRGLDRSWNGEWSSAATTDDKTMTVEVAIPFQTLDAVGLDRDTLTLNLLGTGPGTLGSPDFLSVGYNGFCARWRGFIEAAATEEYTLTVRSDARAVLRIGEEVLIRHEGKGTPSESSATLAMEAGARQELTLEYEEGSGVAAVQLLWSSASTPQAIVPASALYTADGQPGGLSAAYSNRWFEEPILERVDPAIDFAWEDVDLKKTPKAELRSHWPQRPQRCEVFLPLSLGAPKVQNAYTVRLHFAEVADVQPGQRVFGVALQGTPVLETFDIVQEAGGRNVPVIKEFPGIAADDNARITIELTAPEGKEIGKDTAPILSGIEIMAE